VVNDFSRNRVVSLVEGFWGYDTKQWPHEKADEQEGNADSGTPCSRPDGPGFAVAQNPVAKYEDHNPPKRRSEGEAKRDNEVRRKAREKMGDADFGLGHGEDRDDQFRSLTVHLSSVYWLFPIARFDATGKVAVSERG
jgi:hypothetical protein